MKEGKDKQQTAGDMECEEGEVKDDEDEEEEELKPLPDILSSITQKVGSLKNKALCLNLQKYIYYDYPSPLLSAAFMK